MEGESFGLMDKLFTTDGCSGFMSFFRRVFLRKRPPWEGCCIEHDKAYWQGGPKSLRFDPLPGFVTWLFISNMIQIFLMPLIMIGQNLQNRHAEARAESDYEVNVRAEKEIESEIQRIRLQVDRHLWPET